MSLMETSRYSRSCPNFLDIDDWFTTDTRIGFVDDTQMIETPNPDDYRIIDKIDAFLLIYEWTLEIFIQKNKEEMTIRIRNVVKIIQEDDELKEFSVYANCITTLLDVCYVLQIDDSYLVVQLLKILDSQRELDYFFYKTFCLPPFMRCIELFEYMLSEINHLEGENYLIYYLEKAKEERETFGDKWFGAHSHHFVHHCVRYGHTAALEILLRYGFCSGMKSESRNPVSSRKVVTFEELCLYNSQLDLWCKDPDVSHISKKTAVIGISFMHILGIPKGQDEKLWLYSPTEECVKTLQLNLSIVFRAIPVPFCRIPSDIVQLTNSEGETFYEIMYEGIQPCSLQHLCKINIRKSLAESWRLPEGISELNLPKLIRAYIRLDH